MRVFVTGATGFIGSAIVTELLRAGHQVLGLARSDSGAAAVASAGADVHRGSLEDTDSLQRGAAAADGVIHTAFIHDFTDFPGAAQTDKRAIEAMTETLAGSGKPLIVTAGALGSPPPRTEKDSPSDAIPRKSEAAGVAAVARGVRAMVVRLAPSVHGDGDHGFVPALVKTARERGYSTYVGDGSNRWTGVHRFDAATLYRLALEKGVAGARYHGFAESVTVREIAEAIGRKLNVPAVSKTREEALQLLGFVGHALGIESAVDNAITRETLGWQPVQLGLLEDLERGSYFA